MSCAATSSLSFGEALPANNSISAGTPHAVGIPQQMRVHEQSQSFLPATSKRGCNQWRVICCSSAGDFRRAEWHRSSPFHCLARGNIKWSRQYCAGAESRNVHARGSRALAGHARSTQRPYPTAVAPIVNSTATTSSRAVGSPIILRGGAADEQGVHSAGRCAGQQTGCSPAGTRVLGSAVRCAAKQTDCSPARARVLGAGRRTCKLAF